ncbi:MAG TPA: TlpA disulfide reductase family protein [Steroidobacteraceae bacterium]|jgi:peroxiredoxin
MRADKLKLSIAFLAIAAAAAPALPAAGIATGTPAAAFALPAAAGDTVSLAELKGQVVLINFWASWCGPCRQEMPILDQLYKKYKTAGFTLLGVNVEPKSADALSFLKGTPVSFPILFDTQSKVSTLYEVTGMPSTVIIDRRGNIRYIHHGYKPGDEGEYLDQIRTLMRE